MEEQVIAFTSRKLRTLADGSLRLEIDFEPQHMTAAVEMFGIPGTPGAVARLKTEAAKDQLQQEAINPFGQYAKKLKQSGFFLYLDVLKAVGTDEHYQAWCRNQKCAVTKEPDFSQPDGRCVYAHVRRADSSGIGFKGKYRGIPLKHEVHMIQHQKGEREALSYYLNQSFQVESAKAWFDKKASENAAQWAWETLKEKLGFESWKQVPPEVLVEWAKENRVFNYLPQVYKEFS